MKKLLVVFLLMPFMSFSQTQEEKYAKLNIPWQENQIIYTGVVNAEGKSKDQIFNSAKFWFTENFRSSKSVLEIDDREMGVLSGRAWSSVTMIDDGLTDFRGWYQIIIEVKDGRYRYQIKDIEFESMKTTTSDRIQANVYLDRKILYGSNGEMNLKSFYVFATMLKVVEPLELKLKNDLLKKATSDDW